jgi:hypothetical protein
MYKWLTDYYFPLPTKALLLPNTTDTTLDFSIHFTHSTHTQRPDGEQSQSGINKLWIRAASLRAVVQLAEALRYKPEGPRFDS